MALSDLQKKERRTEMLTARVTPTTKRWIEALSKALNRSHADILERLIADGYREIKGMKGAKGGKSG